MPSIKKPKIALGYHSSKTSTPRDIGDPAKARVDTLKWLKGEAPVPEQFNLLLPDDEEALDRYRKDLWVHPERAATLGKSAHQFIAEAGAAEKDLLKSEQTRRQRATRAQTQAAAIKNAQIRLKDAGKWHEFARQVFARDGDETLREMATRIQDICCERGWVPFEDRQDSHSDDFDDDTGYYPSLDTIIRFLRSLAKNQPQ